MTMIIAINVLLFAVVFATILSLKGWAIRTAHRDRLDVSAPRARRERRATRRPLPAHLERRGASGPARPR
jgi:hypothetical protein